MTQVNNLLNILKQKASTLPQQQDTQDQSIIVDEQFDFVIGSRDIETSMSYSQFIDSVLNRIKLNRPDIKESFSKWGKIQLIPFYHFHVVDEQYKLGVSDLVLLADKIHINIVLPRRVFLDKNEDAKYNTMLYLSKATDLKLEINLGQDTPKTVNIIALNWDNAIALADYILDQFIEPNFRYQENIFFEPLDFYNYTKTIVNRTFSTHVIQLEPQSWVFKAYPTSSLIQKVMSLDFVGGNSKFNRYVCQKTVLEFHPSNTNIPTKTWLSYTNPVKKIPYQPSSIVEIIKEIKYNFLDKSPILDHSGELVYLENLIIEKANSEPNQHDGINYKIKNRMDSCLFFKDIEQ
jgi:hypothetical protein